VVESRLEALAVGDLAVDSSEPVTLFASEDGGHSVHWLGIEEPTAFRCNTYLIRDGDQAILVDPGNRDFFQTVRARVERLIPAEQVTGVVICHQDPDVAASLPDWIGVNPRIRVFSSPRTEVLLPHYGVSDLLIHDIEAEPLFALPSGSNLQFLTAPFLHSPMAFATLDTASGFLFSGDIFAAVDSDWRLVIQDFDGHRAKLDLFHLDYMACNAAAVGFVRKLDGLEVNGILPQHGSLIPAALVPEAKAYLHDLQCGLDLLYPDLIF